MPQSAPSPPSANFVGQYTYDLSTPVGQVRLMIPDRDLVNALFADQEITAFLLLEAGDIKCAAAWALEAIASNEALVQKVIKTLDLQTDGSKVSAALREHAVALRASSLTAAFSITPARSDGYSCPGSEYSDNLLMDWTWRLWV